MNDLLTALKFLGDIATIAFVFVAMFEVDGLIAKVEALRAGIQACAEIADRWDGTGEAGDEIRERFPEVFAGGKRFS